MNNRWLTSTIAFLLGLLVVACSTRQVGQPESSPVVAMPDAATVASAQRVVALSSLSADIVFQLDRTKLVGIPGSQLIRSQKAFQHLPIVTSERTPPNLEKIVALKPDWVIGAAGFHDQTLAKLQQLGIRTLSTEVKTWQALEDLTQTLARSLNADPQPLLQRYQTCFAVPAGSQPLKTLVLAGYQPILAPNKASWAGSFLARFKLKNVAAELQGKSPIAGYVTLSPEKILQANPEVLLLVDNGDGMLNKLKSNSFWQQLQAVKTDRVYLFDYYGLINPGNIHSIEKACTQLKQVLTENS